MSQSTDPVPSLTLIPVQAAPDEIDSPGIAPKDLPAPAAPTSRPRWYALLLAGVVVSLATGGASMMLGRRQQEANSAPAAHAPQPRANHTPVQATAIQTSETRSNAASSVAAASYTPTHASTTPSDAAKKAMHPRSHTPFEVDQTPHSNVLQMAYAAMVEGQSDRAAELYNEWLRMHPEERDALLGLAYIAHRSGRSDEALAYYQRVLRQSPEHTQANAGVLTLTRDAGLAQAASRAYDKLDQTPDSAVTLAAWGGILARHGRLTEAALAFARAQSLEPGNATYAYNLAVAQDRLHQYPQALGGYECSLALSSALPDTRQFGFSRDAVLTRLQQLQTAVADQARARPCAEDRTATSAVAER